MKRSIRFRAVPGANIRGALSWLHSFWGTQQQHEAVNAARSLLQLDDVHASLLVRGRYIINTDGDGVILHFVEDDGERPMIRDL